ncbi:translesion DNA synthesis-associated protein ImuA [Noviherbaspirillum massiliense]|uniref:translesion DNA synthesis-associated protein ImuA n=1 Tax=Noviherbaspirillum massiliense TaxID=1465823 RepID=UPI000308C5D1|nr:translesion DNA synthesis-associated protein ImuA [Noviherbaspirillum massiliense]
MTLPLSFAAASGAAGVAAALPDVWLANQMASYRTAAIATGQALLDRELPDGGWPPGALIELLAQQPGIGEMRLLQPALRQRASRALALVQPPHLPQAAAWAVEAFPVERMLWIKASRAADALWAAEQILRNRACGALVLWQPHIRHESLRRLHLAAQAADTLFWMIRPLTAAQEASPAPLRLALRPAAGGIRIDILKRRGPRRDEPLLVPLERMPAATSFPTETSHAFVDQRASSPAAPRDLSSALV